jgi:ABC-type bacteriocin/lantibiotic exporter with double-glycine peptidase domain
VRSHLAGILVHVSKDALMFVAVVTLFLAWISPTMGLFFLMGGGLTASVGYFASHPLEVAARRARHHDGAWATTIQQALEHGHLAPEGAAHDGEETDGRRSTRILGAASVVAHALLGLTVCLAIWTGVAEVRASVLAPGELFLFIAYALMVHRRLVDAGRQLARIGKLRACVERLATLLDASNSGARAAIRPLCTGVCIEGLHLDAVRGSRPRLAGVDLELRAGTRVAIVGRPGDGKSTLLRCLAGLEPAAQRTLRWDGTELGALDPTLCASVGYLPQEPVFSRTPVWKLLGLSGPDGLDAAQAEVLRRVGAWQVIERLSKGTRQKISSATLSRNEARAICLGAALLSSAPLLALDSPFEGLAKRAAAERLEAVLDVTAGRTLVVALPRSRDASAFDRVVVLRRGRIPFDGPPAERKARKAARIEHEVALCRA